MWNLKNVFVADDDIDDQFFFELALKEICADCRVNMSFNGEELIEKLFKYLPALPDLIILDINMPKIDGLQALSIIRSNSEFSHVPVIIYSTSTNPAHKREAYDKGADFYLTKPRNFPDLVKEIKQIFESKFA